ncbi:unnamed protein product [Cuscuta epithymum]|uniref:FHA domain-containing protein n=1 Tax=Cuscuta epithymum TaxID=186058 RepID=A0AAV0GEA6_9ASTE|nr:unnamed protein product [Cuscuta epithymum]CAH9146267.1 unnamed protein product [Cuscuta epithymum]
MDAQGPTLKLTVEKGPLAGQCLEFKPGFTVRLGRVRRPGRGPFNNLVIKDADSGIEDPGISSRHLTVEFNSSDGKWVICDLGSLNGTFLNGDKLDPSCPAALSDSDVIKIGDLTTIKVQIHGLHRASTEEKVNPRAKAATDTAQKDNRIVSENPVLGLADAELGKTKRRPPPRPRGRPQKGSNVISDKVEPQAEGTGFDKGRTSHVEIAIVENTESFSVIETDEDGGQPRTRNGRGRGGRAKAGRATTRSTKQSILQAESVTPVHLDDGNAANSSSLKKDGDELQAEGTGLENASPIRKRNSVKVENFSDGASQVEMNVVEKTDSFSTIETLDLETMTMGEWLAYLEVELPKQIIEASEEMISEMRKKAEMFQEFMKNQKNAKDRRT